MSNKTLINVCFFILITFPSLLPNNAITNNSDIPLLFADDLSEYKIKKTEFYKGKELYGYINGGAEIYLEYGFKKLAVQYLHNSINECKIEIYQMSDHKAAYGIYSISHSHCEIQDTLSKYHCSTPYQLLIAKGPFYITLTNFIGDSVSQNKNISLGKKIISKIHCEEFSIPDAFRHPFHNINREKLIFVRGPIGIQNRLSYWTDLFADLSNYSVYAIQIDDKNNWARAAQIAFENQKDIQLFFDRIKIKDPSKNKDTWRMHLSPNIWQTARYRGDKNIFFIETTKNYKNFQMLLDSMIPENW
jgi:hypothetical protein